METPAPDYTVGLDLGQTADYTALTILQRTWERETVASFVANYTVSYLKRWQLHTAYTVIVSDLAELVQTPPLAWPVLAVDQTGVGRAVVDLIRQVDVKATLRPVTITAGNAITAGDGSWHVPKKELASVVQMLLQSRRIQIAKMPERELLSRELLNFKVKITLAANETFEAWRERDHDDLVLSVALSAWIAEKRGNPNIWPNLSVDAPRPADGPRVVTSDNNRVTEGRPSADVPAQHRRNLFGVRGRATGGIPAQVRRGLFGR